MRYEWDEAKDALNRRKHGYSLADGIPALEDPDRLFVPDDRFDYGEERILTLGHGKGTILAAVSVERVNYDDGEEIIRIISVRKAVKREQESYYFGRT